MSVEKFENVSSEISSMRNSDLNGFDPDKRLDVSDKTDNTKEKSERFDPDKRMTPENVQTESHDKPSNCSDAEQIPDSAADTPDTAENTEQQNPHEEVRDGKTYYYDANGNLYRIDNDLVPNNEYEINGYKYNTDEHGRIISAEGNLHMKERKGRLPIKDSPEAVGKGDQKDTDDRGHLIGDQFDGSNGLENLVPQDADVNQKDFRNFENELAKEVKSGKTVHVNVEPVYEGDSHRPSAIVVTYTIDGEESIRVFPNDREEQ